MTTRILLGHVLDMLPTMAAESVHCIWTSIPYWGLRSYGTEPQIWGGDKNCAHEWGDVIRGDERRGQRGCSSLLADRSVSSAQVDGRQSDKGNFCIRCGAWRGEHGLEPTLEMWLEHEVMIWRELRRVLRKDGVAWLNCGDAYASTPNGRSAADQKAAGTDDRTMRDKPVSTVSKGKRLPAGAGNRWGGGNNPAVGVFKPKDRLMMPSRLVIALHADGWWVRDEIILHKLNPMPSSVKDRSCPAHEMLYMLSRSGRYYYDYTAIQEPISAASEARYAQPTIDTQAGGPKQDGFDNSKNGSRRPNEIVKALAKKQNSRPAGGWSSSSSSSSYADQDPRYKKRNKQDSVPGKSHRQAEGFNDREFEKEAPEGRLKRSVWSQALEPFPGAHFATAPTGWVRPCILAATSQRGVCPACGAPWYRETETYVGDDGKEHKRFTGHWIPDCDCAGNEPVPATVLDPFFGSGTTGLVANELGREAVGIELNPAYAEIARSRLRDALIKVDSPLPEPTGADLPLFAGAADA